MKLLRYLPIIVFGFSFALSSANGQETDSGYLDELEDSDGEWIVVSQHYKHTENCMKLGCILMGPVASQDECKDWAKDYNKKDPFDHARCVDGTGYLGDDEGQGS